METRANFLIVGLFIAINVALALRFVLFIEDAGWAADAVYYELAFSDVGANVTRGSPINFNGVKVGEVAKGPIQWDSALVVMLARIDRSAPIRSNTKAKVELPSLMGGVVISLEGVAGEAPALEALPGQRYPRIIVQNSAVSHFNFDDFSARFARLSERARQTLGGIPSELSAMKWRLDPVAEVIQPLLTDSGRSEPGGIDIGTIESMTGKLEAMIAATQRFVKENSLSELERKSRELDMQAAVDLARLERLASDLRKKVNMFEQKVRDTGLTQTRRGPSKGPLSQSQETGRYD